MPTLQVASDITQMIIVAYADSVLMLPGQYCGRRWSLCRLRQDVMHDENPEMLTM